MTTTIEPVQEVPLQEDTGYQLVAVDGPQLKTAHAKMIEWAKEQQSKCDVEKAGEEENLRIAEERKWSTTHFKKRITALARRRVFFEKIELALHAGYVIVPNFEMTVFAIRTAAETPRVARSSTSWGSLSGPASQQLPAGEGDYKNPDVDTFRVDEKVPDGKGGTREQVRRWTSDEFKELDFPIALAKPVLMTKTAEAMAARIFDEVGVAVDTARSGGWRGNRRGDPFILGRIRNPQKRADVTFFIGWYFDPTNL